jgi:uncharacterized protein YhfF
MTDRDPTVEFWSRAAGARGLDATASPPPAWSFADTPRLADELLDAVLAGRKTGTSTTLLELADDGEPVPHEGDLSILLDGAGAPRALIRTTSALITTFDRVDAGFAASEGEDDLSLEAWREGHARYFERVLAARGLPPAAIGELELVLERFELVYTEPPGPGISSASGA